MKRKVNVLLEYSKYYDRGNAITFSEKVTHKLRIGGKLKRTVKY